MKYSKVNKDGGTYTKFNGVTISYSCDSVMYFDFTS